MGFLGGQLQDLHSLCDLDGLLQAEQHEIVAVVLSGEVSVVLQEAQVELRVWEDVADKGKLGCVFVLKQVVATQPDLVIAGEGEDGDSEHDGGGGKGYGAGEHEEGSKVRKRNRDRRKDIESQKKFSESENKRM